MSAPGWTTWALAAAAIACNAIAQVLMKRAAVVDGLDWRLWLQPSLAAAVALYGVSFALTALVFARLPLTVASPLMAGAIFIAITVLSALFLGEQLTATRAIGMLLVLAGIALLARSA